MNHSSPFLKLSLPHITEDEWWSLFEFWELLLWSRTMSEHTPQVCFSITKVYAPECKSSWSIVQVQCNVQGVQCVYRLREKRRNSKVFTSEFTCCESAFLLATSKKSWWKHQKSSKFTSKILLARSWKISTRVICLGVFTWQFTSSSERMIREIRIIPTCDQK